jgi:two-component system, LuxR family, response regulator FixJ
MSYTNQQCVQAVAELSPRQRAVLRAIAECKPTKNIADELGVSYATVKVHRVQLYARLGIHSNGEAIRIAMASKLI